MTTSEKHEIIVAASELINMLEDCDDFDFVDTIIDCVTNGDSYPLEVENW